VRSLPNIEAVPQADASGQLEELDGDDILESDDIDALEAAAAGITSFEVDTSEPQPVAVVASAPAPAPAPEPSGFEVGDLDSFDEVQVEGAAPAPAPAPAPARAPAAMSAMSGERTGESIQVNYARPAAAPAPAPAAMSAMTGESIQVHYAAPVPTTAAGIPAAPVTSPLPLEEQASVIVSEPMMQERTLEIRGNDMAKVAAAAAKLEAETNAPAEPEGDGQPGHTEVLVRSAMPAALQTATVRGSMQAVPTPAPAAVARAPHVRPSSIAPVAVDVAGPRPTMGSIPAIPLPPRMPSNMPPHAAMAPKRGMSGLAIGALVFAAVAVVGTVGVGGFFASRALSEKSDSTASAPAESAPESAAVAASPNGSPATAGQPSDPSAAASSPIDVSSLPAAPVPGSAPRGFTGKGTATFTPPAAPVPAPAAAPAPLAVAGGVAPAAAPAAAPPPPAPRAAGGALPAPGSGQTSRAPSAPAAAGAPLAAPVAAAAPPPPKAAPVSTTGVVQVDPSLRAVIVDGSYRRANDGSVTVSCGSHRIKAGMKEQQTVNVPCGGSVSLF
jgi:hypothetical protein